MSSNLHTLSRRPGPLGSALLGLGLSASLSACADGDTDTETDTEAGVEVPATYDFDSRFEDASSVSYSGQVARHVLINDLKAHIGTLTADIDDLTIEPAAGDIEAELTAGYLEFNSDDSPGAAILTQTDPEALQSTYDEISTGKDLLAKLAGNDATGQHMDWTAGMAGWGDGTLSPEVLVRDWFAKLDALAVDRAAGTVPTDPDGQAIAEVFVTAEGQDLQQLIQKFLLGAIAFSQGADDYLDDDTEGKGLLSDHTAAEEGKPYTALEHAWDEGFGYFGAARDYGDYSDAQVSDGEVIDSDGDGRTDLTAEYNFGHSQNASKRDKGSAEGFETDFSAQAFEAFRTGRAIIADADGALTDDQLDALKAQRDLALDAWEKAIAATVVHYINDVLIDMGTIGTDDYDFMAHAKHWSELKGFALSLQFNRRSPILDDFEALHAALGDAPALPGDDGLEDYADDLRQARTLLGDAYGFAAENLGDDDGAGGW